MTATTDHAHTDYATSKRREKAAHLVAALLKVDADADAAARMDDEGWRRASRLANVRLPSPETRRMVVDMLAHSVAERAVRCPTCGLGNPRGGDGAALPAGHSGECAR